MRILLVSSQFPPDIGGGGAYTYYLATALSSFSQTSAKSACHVQVLTGGASNPTVERRSQFLHVHRGTFSREGRVPFEATIQYGLDLCRRFAPTIVHGQHFDGAYVALQLKAAFPDLLACATLHKSPSGTTVFGEQMVDPQTLAIMSMASAIDKMIATCLVYRKELSGIGVPSRKIATIWPGVDTPRLVGMAAGRKRIVIDKLKDLGLDLAKYDKLILCPARVDPTKDLETFVRAAGILKATFKGLRLAFLIAGRSAQPSAKEESYTSDLYSIAARQQLANDLYLGGFQIDEMYSLFKLSAVCVLPSVREALGLVLLEGMALRTPMVVTNSTGMSDVVSNETNALTFPARDQTILASQVGRILSDRDLASRLRELGLQTVLRRFSYARMATEHVDLYRMLRLS